MKMKKRIPIIAPAGVKSVNDRIKLEKMGYRIVFPFEHRRKKIRVI